MKWAFQIRDPNRAPVSGHSVQNVQQGCIRRMFVRMRKGDSRASRAD
jgi:hypothetical protein